MIKSILSLLAPLCLLTACMVPEHSKAPGASTTCRHITSQLHGNPHRYQDTGKNKVHPAEMARLHQAYEANDC